MFGFTGKDVALADAVAEVRNERDAWEEQANIYKAQLTEWQTEWQADKDKIRTLESQIQKLKKAYVALKNKNEA